MADVNPYDYQENIDPDAWEEAQAFANKDDPWKAGLGALAGGTQEADGLTPEQRAWKLFGDIQASDANNKERTHAYLSKNAPYREWMFPSAIAKNRNNYYSNYHRDEMARAGTRAPISFNNQNEQQSRLEADRTIQQLHQLAQGNKDASTAQQELSQNARMSAGQAGGLAAARGNYGGAGAAMRQVRQAQQGIQAGAQEASSALQAQEQAAAQALLSQMYASQHAGDISAATQGARIGTANKATNQNYALGSASAAIGTDLDDWGTQSNLAAAELQAQYDQSQIDRGFLGAGMGAGATLYGGLGKYAAATTKNDKW